MSISVSAPEAETSDIFNVTQVTRDTPLEDIVGADLVAVDPHQTSSIHRHNEAETVLYIIEGEGVVSVGNEQTAVRAGQRLLVPRGEFHGVTTGDSPLRFLSVQSPPILNRARGTLDFEPLK